MTREQDITKAIEDINRVKPFFWNAPSPGEIPPKLTMDSVDVVEQELGLRLPKSYLALLSLQNGGEPRYGGYGTISEDDEFYMDDLSGIVLTDEGSSLLKLRHEFMEWKDAFKEDLAETSVFLWETGHEWLALDYRQCGPGGEPSVMYLDNEVLDEDDLVRTIAPNLMAFIEGLFNSREEATQGKLVYGFVGADDSSQLVAALQRSLGTQFKQSSSGDRDEPTFECRSLTLGGHRIVDPYIGVFSNRLSLPEPDGRFQTNLDYPTHPECNWILWCDIDLGWQEDLEDKLKEVSYKMVPIHIPEERE